MDFDQLLGEQLSIIADDPAPCSSIDAGHAIALGQRIALRRRTAGAGTTLAVLGLAAGLGFTLTGGAAAPSSASNALRPAASVSPTPRLVGGIDPLTLDEHFGALPSSLVVTNVSVGDTGLEQIQATDSARNIFTVTLLPGSGPALSAGGYQQAPDVNGETAYWETGSGPSGTTNGMMWQYSRNDWADLTFTAMAGGQPSRAEFKQIADAAHFGPHAFPLPLSLPSATGFRLGKETAVTYNTDGSLKMVTVTLTTASNHTLTMYLYPDGSIDLPAHAGCVFPSTGTAAGDKNTAFWVNGCNGLLVQASVDSRDPATVAAVAHLLNGAVWYGTNPDYWTTSVFPRN